MDPAANLVGAGCAAYAEQVPSGAGSVSGMALDPVAVAASNNPILTTLTAAVSGKLNPKVDLVDTLNGSEFTVFAPTDDAFAKIDAATIETLKTDDALLSKILTYHVVPGKISPDEIVGTHKTVQGGSVTVTGTKDALKVDERQRRLRRRHDRQRHCLHGGLRPDAQVGTAEALLLRFQPDSLDHLGETKARTAGAGLRLCLPRPADPAAAGGAAWLPATVRAGQLE